MTLPETSGSVTVIGAGRIGSALVRRWRNAGWDVVVWNRTPARADALRDSGARVEANLANAVASASAVVSVLTDGPAVEESIVGKGVLPAMTAGALLVDLSTIDAGSSGRIAAAATAHGVRFVRGALSGSPGLVESGRASALLSGAPAEIGEALALLQPVVAGATVVGEREEAKAVKLAINAMVGSAVLAVAEAMVTIDAAGVSRDVFVAALENSAVWSPVVGYKSIALRDDDRTVTATTGALIKDMELAVAQQRANGVRANVSAAVLRELQRAAAAGLREEDCIRIATVLGQAKGLSD